MGGRVDTLIQDTSHLFDNNILLKYNTKFRLQSGSIIGFASEYVERLNEDQKQDKKNKVKLDVKIGLGK